MRTCTILKHIFTNSAGILVSRILGFLRDLLTASILGANIYSDILTWLEDIQIPEFANFKRALTAKFNKVLNDHLTVFQYIDNYITNNISANDTHNSTSTA